MTGARGVALFCVLAAASACGPPAPGEDSGPGDAGAVDAGSPPVDWPLAPAAPELTPCPEGWASADSGGVETCAPWQDGGARDCAPHEAQFPGAPGCERVGTPCAADGWPSDLPSDRPIVFVDDDAPAGGDGSSRASAVRTIDDALSRASTSAIIAVAAGRYDLGAGALLEGSRTLWGACVEGTRLTSSSPAVMEAVVQLAGAGSGLRNLTIDAPERMGVISTGAGTRVEAVVVDGARSMAFAVLAGSSTFSDVVARDVRSATDRTLGRGINLQGGAALSLSRALVLRSRETGVFAIGPATTLVGTDVAVRETLGIEADGDAGRCVQAQGGARVELSRSVLEGGRQSGVIASDLETTVSLADVVVRDTRGRARDGTSGRGLSGGNRARFELTRVHVDGSREGGVTLSDGATLVARDLVVTRTLGRASDGAFGRALTGSAGATLDVERVLVSETAELGLSAFSGSSVEARDVRVRESTGRGVSVQSGASASLERALVEGSGEVGVFLDFEETTVRLADVEIADTRGRSDGRYGFGVLGQFFAVLEASRVRVRGARVAGVAGVDGASLALYELAVEGVQGAACAETTCPELVGGFALSAHFGAALTASDFVLEDAALCGVVVGAARDELDDTSVDLSRGVVDRAPVGACVQIEGYAVERLRREVEYRDVGVPLQATSYELPGAL